jgi:hypothetical protein
MAQAPPALWKAMRRTWLCRGLVALSALALFARDLEGEPHFVDESAYISQAYFAELYGQGAWNDRAWLEYPALDLPPLPKYLIGLALHAQGYRAPSRAAAIAWYGNTQSRAETPAMLLTARWPSVLLGVLGCLAVFELGTLAGDWRVGALAAFLVMVNPLYRLHARRAMADVPAEALILATAALGLWAWRNALAGRPRLLPWLLTTLGVGVLGGLAVEAKLNGVLALMTVASWGVLGLALVRLPIARRLAFASSTVLAAIVALAVFVVLNPFLTAHPRGPLPPALKRLADQDLWQRTKTVLEHRMMVSREGMDQFSHNALRTLGERLRVVVTQGLGRFGPLGPAHSDSTRRYDWAQDRGALLWAPCVTLGACWALMRGRHQLRLGQPPTAWALALLALVACVTVTAYIPLAWDRYFLSLQAGFALLAAGGMVAAGDTVISLVRRREEG